MADSHGPAYLHTRYLQPLLTQCRNSLLSMEDLNIATNKKRTNFLILNWHRFRRGRFDKRSLPRLDGLTCVCRDGRNFPAA